jgi:hypothetical protein
MRSGSHTEAKRHKIKERERPYQELYFKGKQGCRKAFGFIYNTEKINVLSITGESFLIILLHDSP